MKNGSLHSSPISRVRIWIRNHKKASSLIVLAVAAIITAGVVTALYYQEPTVAPPTPTASEPEPEPKIHYSLLTGEEVESEAAITTPVTAIILENSPDARPQSGMKDAEVVYEAIAEGGITRFLAFYQNKKPELIGPVRSLRMYYVDWIAPYNASVAHVGGSLNALNEIRNGNYRDIDQFFNPGTYWRATDRYAPHNVYTSFSNIDALNQAKGYTESTFTSFPRADGEAAEAPNANHIAVNFSSPLYNTTYTYDKANNRYLRFMGGVAHNDREAGHITPSVVIALRVNMQHVMEDGYREQITTVGTGSAVLFQNGNAQEVSWQKTDRQAPLRIIDSEGNDIPLVRGQTWIAAVPLSGGSISWQP